jgi:flagellar biosynthesis/type III secretory pathway protein FliH
MQKTQVHGVERGPIRIEEAPFGLGEFKVEAIPWLPVQELEVRPWVPEGDLFAPPQETEQEPVPTVEGDPSTGQALEAEGPESPPEETEAAGEDEDVALDPGPSRDEHEAALAEQLDAQAQTLAEPYVAAAVELRRAASHLNQNMDEAVIQMALAMAEVLLRKEAEVSQDLLKQTLDQALSLVGPVDELALEVHPDDLELCRRLAPGLADEIAGKAVKLAVSASHEVDRATCIVHFDRGVVDARWKARLLQLAAAVRQSLSDGDPTTPVSSPPDPEPTSDTEDGS